MRLLLISTALAFFGAVFASLNDLKRKRENFEEQSIEIQVSKRGRNEEVKLLKESLHSRDLTPLLKEMPDLQSILEVSKGLVVDDDSDSLEFILLR